MTDTPKTKGELVIEQIMKQLDPASPRYRVLSVARQFKSSWVELGEQLSQVRNKGDFNDWGYSSFEDYCRDEVRIKKDTALKLTGAYSFLKKVEPEILVRNEQMLPVPDYRSIDLLRQAQEEQQISEEQYQQLREAVIEKGRSHPTVSKQFRELTGQTNNLTEEQLLRQSLATVRRLEGQLQQLQSLPQEILQSCSLILDELNRQSTQIETDAEK